ncbi:hypothetical protein JP0551_04190 [Helicobacter pylori]
MVGARGFAFFLNASEKFGMRAKMKNIYLDVKASIEKLQNIFRNTNNENERLKKSNQEALEVFQKLEFESLKELESLKNNEEWENFTIAFYLKSLNNFPKSKSSSSVWDRNSKRF